MTSDPLNLSDVPGPDATEAQLFDFAAGINGYDVAGGFHECADIANSPNRNSIDELRVAMFFHLRALRHAGEDMDEFEVTLFRDYNARIRELLMEQESPGFRCRAARASVLLHEEHLQGFIEVWKQAKSSGVNLPEVEDPDFASYDALLRHVLRWSRTYLMWICENLDLPEPVIGQAPLEMDGDDDLMNYTDQLLAAWKTPLRQIPSKRFVDQEYPAPWGALYCIDAMLEHAVMHPIKHRFQLEELLGER